MAVLFLKSMYSLFPRGGGSRYMPVSPSSPISDIERGNSVDSDDTLTADAYPEKEKGLRTPSITPSFRVNPRIIADATIGLSDGLTVPFALTAGLSALGDTKIVVYGGLAELIAGGISMGLGGYLGAKSEAEAYYAALAETKTIVHESHEKASDMVCATFSSYDFSEEALSSMTNSLLASPTQMVDFLMRFHHQLTEADYAPSRAYVSGLTISAGYFFGGLVPLLPYFLAQSVHKAFFWSMVVMVVALFAFGWSKTSLLGEKSSYVCLTNAFQMVLLGGVAAGAAMGCVKAIGT